MDCLGDRPAEKLLPYLPLMDQYHRVQALAHLCEPRLLTTKVRQTLLAIAGEPNRYVREAALKYLKKSKLAEDEVQTLEGYLTRKTADFRRSIFELLLNRSDKLVLATIDRLLAAGDANCRAAGIELSAGWSMTNVQWKRSARNYELTVTTVGSAWPPSKPRPSRLS